MDSELEQAGHTPSKGEGKIRMARQRVLEKYLGADPKADKQMFADPMALFQ